MRGAQLTVITADGVRHQLPGFRAISGGVGTLIDVEVDGRQMKAKIIETSSGLDDIQAIKAEEIADA